MQEQQREILDRFAVELKNDVIPTETLPYLPCLTEDDREAVESRQEHKGKRAAVPVLLDRLKKRSGSFEQFLRALQSTGCGHLKKLLAESISTPDERLNVPQTEEATGSTKETTRRLQSQLSLPSEETDYSEFDLLVCYAQKDKEVAYEMRDKMMEYNLRVCIDEVNFIVGKAMAENICDSIRCSKTIVFLLSPDFLEKKWAHWEMQHALLEFLDKKSSAHEKKIIPVLLKECDIPDALRPYTPLNFKEEKDWKRLATAVKESQGTDNGADVTSDVLQETGVPGGLTEKTD